MNVHWGKSKFRNMYKQTLVSLFCHIICHFWGQNEKIFKNEPHFQIRDPKIVLGSKFQPNRRNLFFFNQNFAIFGGQNERIFKNGPYFLIRHHKIDHISVMW